jgi:hypothetical protein
MPGEGGEGDIPSPLIEDGLEFQSRHSDSDGAVQDAHAQPDRCEMGAHGADGGDATGSGGPDAVPLGDVTGHASAANSDTGDEPPYKAQVGAWRPGAFCQILGSDPLNSNTESRSFRVKHTSPLACSHGFRSHAPAFALIFKMCGAKDPEVR